MTTRSVIVDWLPDTEARNVAANKTDNNAALGFEDKLWLAADVLRNNMDPAEYKHVVLGLIFLKYISDAFEERQEQILRSLSDPESEDFVEDPEERAAELAALREDRDEYTAENVFWVPPTARWAHLQAQAKKATIGKALDEAMDAIEAENVTLKGALPKVYALPNLDKRKLGELIDLVSGIGLGTAAHREKGHAGPRVRVLLGALHAAPSTPTETGMAGSPGTRRGSSRSRTGFPGRARSCSWSRSCPPGDSSRTTSRRLPSASSPTAGRWNMPRATVRAS